MTAHNVVGLVTIAECQCGATFEADSEGAALDALLDHRRQVENATPNGGINSGDNPGTTA
jgi:hypothetical protein